MADSFSKKENNKKKTKKLQDKQLRREDRKDNNNKGKTLDDMIVYVDVNGHFTSVPPHLQDKDEDLARAKRAQESAAIDPNADYSGVVTYLSDKGYGFITEDKTAENIFFHIGQLSLTLDKHTRVTYKKELTPKGFRAIDIRKITQ